MTEAEHRKREEIHGKIMAESMIGCGESVDGPSTGTAIVAWVCAGLIIAVGIASKIMGWAV